MQKGERFLLSRKLIQVSVLILCFVISFASNDYLKTRAKSMKIFAIAHEMPFTGFINIQDFKSSSKYYNQFSGGFYDVGLRIFAKKYLGNLNYYDVYIQEGTLRYPEPFEKYRYDQNLWMKGVSGVLFVEKFIPFRCNLKSFDLIRLLREGLDNLFNFTYSGRSRNLLKGMLLGQRGALSDDQSELFSSLGLQHIVVASGQNMAYVLVLGGFLLKFVPFFLRSILLTILCLLFALIVGDEPSIWRAFLLVFFLQIGNILGRQVRPVYILILIAYLMSLFRPFIVLFDVAFQLSFMAFLGVFFMGNIGGKYFTRKFPFGQEALALIGAQGFVLPLILFYFGYWNPVSLLANLFVILALIPILILGIVAIPFKIIFQADILGYFLSKYYFVFESILEFINKFSVTFDVSFPLWLFIFIQAVILVVVLLISYKNKWV